MPERTKVTTRNAHSKPTFLGEGSKKPDAGSIARKIIKENTERNNPPEINHWGRLTRDQLRGADFAYRLLRTSPVIRGAALGLLDGLIRDVRAEMEKQPLQIKAIYHPAPDECPRDICPPDCEVWKKCERGKETACPWPTMCWCRQICRYHKRREEHGDRKKTRKQTS